MSDTIISAEHISKAYRLGQIGGGTLREDFSRWWARLLRKPDPFLKIGEEHHARKMGEQFWALDDVSFQVKQGEVLGIIGRNGAGKSTLLKILSRVTTPTSGQVKIKGRIASLLEVGTGFHPELTGRENVFLNGAILGMTKAEIRKKFDEIVAFSEIEEFIDTPVKRYSSGMYVRLAFAVAAHLEPEILICDEVLAVGDAQFQKKCLGKMQDVSQRQGRTVLFVSHNMGAVAQLTTRCLLLALGKNEFSGSPEIAIEKYSNVGSIKSLTSFNVGTIPRKVWGNQDARIQSLRFERNTPRFVSDEDFSFVIKIKANKNLPNLRTSFTIFSADGVPIGGVFGQDTFQMKSSEECEFRVTLPSPSLAPGNYYCDVGIGRGNPCNGHVDYDVVFDTLQFEVFPREGEDGTVGYWTSGWGRIMFPSLSTEQLT